MVDNKELYEIAEWEEIAYDCEKCDYHSERVDGITKCENCGSEDIYWEFNYDGMQCTKCNSNVDIDRDVHAKKDGDFEEIICDNCYSELPMCEEES